MAALADRDGGIVGRIRQQRTVPVLLIFELVARVNQLVMPESPIDTPIGGMNVAIIGKRLVARRLKEARPRRAIAAPAACSQPLIPRRDRHALDRTRAHPP